MNANRQPDTTTPDALPASQQLLTALFVHPDFARDPREIEPVLDEWDHGRAAAIRAAIDNLKTENARRRVRR